MTLSRVLESEVMDSPEEARDYDSMDHSHVNALFAADFLERWDGTGTILDVGAGTAQIPIALCARHPQAEILAIDASQEMLILGRANVLRAGFAERIALEACDAKRLPLVDDAFGAVISNSIVHHIPEPSRVLREMCRVLRPGGLLLVRDLHRPQDDAEVERLVTTYAADATPRQRALFDASLRAALTLTEVRQLVVELGWPADSVQLTSDRHWTWTGRKIHV